MTTANIAAIGDPWSVDIKYPTIKPFCSFPKNKKEIEAKTKGIAAYRQTFSWLGDGFLMQPRLVLGYEISPGYYERVEDYKVVPKFERRWRRIAHQHSGMLCNHTYMFARVLTPTPYFLDSMKAIVSANSSVSEFGPYLTEAINYRKSLKMAAPRIKLSCEETFTKLSEGIYPLDLSEEVLKQICVDRLPSFDKNWVKQFKMDGGFNDMFKAPHYMKLYIFGENSD